MSYFLDIFYPKTCITCKKPGKYICKACLEEVGEGRLKDQIYSVWKYEGVIKSVILALKYRFAYDIVQELADLCVLELKHNSYFINLKSVLLPVPLHTQRQNWRGFNQAELIGKIVAKNMGWQFNSKLIIKTTASQPQVELTRNQRLRNLSGKFAVNPNFKEKIDPNSTYIIFDDVATTGSTIKEIVKVLKENNIEKAWGLTIAS